MGFPKETGKAENPARVRKARRSPEMVYDALEALVDAAKRAHSVRAREKALEKMADILVSIDDINFLHAMYEMRLCPNETVKQLVVQRFFALLNDMDDVDALLAIQQKGCNRNFLDSISLRIENVVGTLSDKAKLQKIRHKETGFDFRAQAMAELMLTYTEMEEEKLFHIAKGKECVNDNRSVALMSKAASYLSDETALAALAFDMHRSFEVVIQAQMRLTQLTEDPALLGKIKEQVGYFIQHEEYAPMVPVIRQLADQRLAELLS